MFHPTTRGLPTTQSILSPESLPLNPASVSTEPTPQPNPPFNFTMLDLEMLHYYILEGAVGYLDKSELAETFRTTVIQIAFEHAFLMHELLSLSALSLAHHRPEKRDLYLHASDTHVANALALFQPEIANLTEKNCHACFIFSTAFLTHAWVSQDLEKPSNLFFRPSMGDNEGMNVHWITLHRGTNAIMHQFFALLCSGPLRILISPFQELKQDRADPVSEEEELQLSYLIEAWCTSDRLSEEDKVVLDKAVLAVRRVYSMLTYYPDVSKHAVVMNWFAIISDEYLQMLERKVPEAVLIAIYQCVALKELDHVWWTRGKAENLLRTLYDVLDERWEPWTVWPVLKVFGSKEALLMKQFKTIDQQ